VSECVCACVCVRVCVCVQGPEYVIVEHTVEHQVSVCLSLFHPLCVCVCVCVNVSE
jgi:hypothetical protein